MTAVQGSSARAIAELPFAPRQLMQDLPECAPALPRSLNLLVVAYYFEITPKDLIGRVQFRCRNNLAAGGELGPHDGMTVFLAYNRIETLFNQVIGFGKEFGCDALAKEYIQTVAETQYTYREQIPDGIIPHTCWHVGRVSGNLKDWILHLGKDVLADISEATTLRHEGQREDWHTNRCDTRYAPNPGKMTLEQAIAYAPQVGNMENVRQILDRLQIKSGEPTQKLLLCSPEQDLEKDKPVNERRYRQAELNQVVETDPSVPKDCQDLTREIEVNIAAQGQASRKSSEKCVVS